VCPAMLCISQKHFLCVLYGITHAALPVVLMDLLQPKHWKVLLTQSY